MVTMVRPFLCAIAVAFLYCGQAICQWPSTTSTVSCQPGAEQKAASMYEGARNSYRSGQTNEALTLLSSSLQACPLLADTWMLLGVIYEDVHNIDSSILCYRKALSINPNIFNNAYFTLARLEYSVGEYLQADKNLNTFLSKPNISEKLKARAQQLLTLNIQALELTKNAVEFKPVNLGDSINTSAEEYLPLISLDDKSLIFTRRYSRSEPTPHLEEDFFISELDSIGGWSLARRMPEPVNSDGNEGAQSLSADGKYLYFAGCSRTDGFGSCDIYVCVKNGDKWGKPINLGYPINTPSWESQPSISSDGRTLYFCSNNESGYGGSDLWKSVRSEQGIWSEPINLGSTINTSGNENSPFIHPDQKTLYFASDKHPGLGGLDIFYSHLKEKGDWDKPINIGYPINTYANESTLSVNREGNTAYFSSAKLDGKGALDIYRFELYKAARPNLVSFMKGFVSDALSGKSLNAKFELIDLQTSSTTVESFSDAENGEFLVCLPSGKEYALNVAKDGYLFYSENIVLNDSNAFTPMYKSIKLAPIASGQTMVLRNIFFSVNSMAIDSSSFVELGKLLNMLESNPLVKIEVSGHTDISGKESYNLMLSKNRAQSVANYLINKGIKAERIKTIGYGASKPVAPNDEEAGRKLNRRTEIKIL